MMAATVRFPPIFANCRDWRRPTSAARDLPQHSSPTFAMPAIWLRQCATTSTITAPTRTSTGSPHWIIT